MNRELAEDIRNHVSHLEDDRSEYLLKNLRFVYRERRSYDKFWSTLHRHQQPIIAAALQAFAADHGLQPPSLLPDPKQEPILVREAPALDTVSEIELRKQAIRNLVVTLRIPYIVHFTRVDNLASILEIGICPPLELQKRAVEFVVNDAYRYNLQRGATSFSIAHPNDKLFYRWQKELPEHDWVLLLIDPSVLWTHDAAYFVSNAASQAVRSQSTDKRRTVRAFEAMFAPRDDLPTREEQGLLPYDPTDVQAEVLVFDAVLPKMIKGIRFTSAAAMASFSERFSGDMAAVPSGRGAYGLRSAARRAQASI